MSDVKASLSTRAAIFELLKEYGFAFALIIDVIVVVCYGYFKIDYSVDTNLIIGKFVVIVLSGLTAPASFVAFLTVIVASKKQWGEVEMLKTHIGIGSLMGLITAVIALIKAFKAV